MAFMPQILSRHECVLTTGSSAPRRVAALDGAQRGSRVDVNRRAEPATCSGAAACRARRPTPARSRRVSGDFSRHFSRAQTKLDSTAWRSAAPCELMVCFKSGERMNVLSGLLFAALLLAIQPSPAAAFQGNEIVNGDAETGDLTGWTDALGHGFSVFAGSGSTQPHGGNWCFHGGTHGPSGPMVSEGAQDIGVSQYAPDIDAGLLLAGFQGYARSNSDGTNTDTAEIVLEYLDASFQLLESYSSGIAMPVNTWVEVDDHRWIPSLTRTIRVRLIASRQVGMGTDGFFDDLVLVVGPVGVPMCFGDGSAAPCGCSNEATPGSGGGCANGAPMPAGQGAVLSATGTNSVVADDLVLTADFTTNQPGLFFQGNNAIGGGTGTTFGDGIRCCGGSVVRLEIVDPPGPAGPKTASTTQPILGTSPPGTTTPGDTRCYQWWYRNPGTSLCGSNFNLSNSMLVTWTL